MNRLTIEIYDLEAEIIAFEEGYSEKLEIVFSESYDGFITAGGITSRVKEGKCIFDLRLMDEGETVPTLILREGKITLPTIKKEGTSITLVHPGPDYLMRLSHREKLLAKRVVALEKRIEELSNSITGVSIL